MSGIREVAGNGVVTTRVYCAKDARLLQLALHAPGGTVLQDLRYGYDPAGNVCLVEDAASPVTFHRNQRVEPLRRMVYDSLYRLIEAHGVEVDTPSHGPHLPPLYGLPLDPTRLINYQQRFTYDACGNLLQRQHSGRWAASRMRRSGEQVLRAGCSIKCCMSIPPASEKNRFLPNVAWTTKRTQPGEGLFSRMKLTMHMSGPSLIRQVVGEAALGADANVLPTGSFWHNERTVHPGKPTVRNTNELFLSGYKKGLDGSGRWAAVRPGRRASIG